MVNLISQLSKNQKLLRAFFCETCFQDCHAHILSNFGSIMLNNLNLHKINIFDPLFVTSGLLNSYIKFHPDQKCLSFEP